MQAVHDQYSLVSPASLMLFSKACTILYSFFTVVVTPLWKEIVSVPLSVSANPHKPHDPGNKWDTRKRQNRKSPSIVCSCQNAALKFLELVGHLLSPACLFRSGSGEGSCCSTCQYDTEQSHKMSLSWVSHPDAATGKPAWSSALLRNSLKQRRD